MKKIGKIISQEPLSIVVKGFMGKPARLKFVKKNACFTTVLCRDGTTQIDFANDVVYKYDEKAYKRLKNAYENNDIEGLEKLWQQAKPILST